MRVRSARVTGWALMAAGVAVLIYCVWAFTDLWSWQRTRSRAFDQALESRISSSVGALPARRPRVRYGETFGQIEIPRLGFSAMVAEGDGDDVLRHAAGHISGTAMPGNPGNVGIAGHRDSLFRSLREVRDDDVIVLRTLEGEFDYRVDWTRIVPPADVQVLDPAGGQTLTLVTCYPFYYVGSAPKRFIVRAARE